MCWSAGGRRRASEGTPVSTMNGHRAAGRLHRQPRGARATAGAASSLGTAASAAAAALGLQLPAAIVVQKAQPTTTTSGQQTCDNVLYRVHPNLGVTREVLKEGRPIEMRYAGEYVFMNAESQTVFVNYVPQEEPVTLQYFAHCAHTPRLNKDRRDDYLLKHLSSLENKLCAIANAC